MVVKRRRRFAQVTCWCQAYTFPHRIGGGKCSGAEWVASYREIIAEACLLCNEYTEYGCVVADGRESYEECEGYHDCLHRGSSVCLPQTVEDFGEMLLNRYQQQEEEW